jgi:hypothetical protein
MMPQKLLFLKIADLIAGAELGAFLAWKKKNARAHEYKLMKELNTIRTLVIF